VMRSSFLMMSRGFAFSFETTGVIENLVVALGLPTRSGVPVLMSPTPIGLDVASSRLCAWARGTDTMHNTKNNGTPQMATAQAPNQSAFLRMTVLYRRSQLKVKSAKCKVGKTLSIEDKYGKVCTESTTNCRGGRYGKNKSCIGKIGHRVGI
jgi:hypothetical protein